MPLVSQQGECFDLNCGLCSNVEFTSTSGMRHYEYWEFHAVRAWAPNSCVDPGNISNDQRLCTTTLVLVIDIEEDG
jgi:hypothetical protein